MKPADLAQLLDPLSPEERAQLLHGALTGFDDVVGLRYSWLAADRVVGNLQVGDRHLQPYGLCHGGVYATMVESACSTGAALELMGAGLSVVGVENSTRFERGARAGALLTIVATPGPIPPSLGRPLQDPREYAWEAEIRDERGRRMAIGRVVVRALAEGVVVGGEAVSLQARDPSAPTDDGATGG